MRNLIKYLLQGKGLNLVLCAMTISFCTPALAQDDEFEEVETSIKQPTRQRTVKANYPMMTLHGVVIDQNSKKPLAGIQLRTLGNEMYTAMTKADGSFTINVPTFTTSLYV